MMSIINTFIAFIFLCTIISCSTDLSKHLPDKVDNKNQTRLIAKKDNENALKILNQNEKLKELLDEFISKKISCATYDFSGIKIIYAIAQFQSGDDAFGMYSGLTAKPRERFKLSGGEISYKMPYFAGFKGNYVLWFWSPTNPSTYAPFYKKSADEILQALELNADNSLLSYHWKILPEENMVSDSILFIRSRLIQGFNFKNAYCAEYQTSNMIGNIYVQLFDSTEVAKRWYEEFKKHILSNKKKIVSFENFKLQTYYWYENNSYHIVHQYKWIVLFLDKISSLAQAKRLVSIMYFNMQKMRGEVLKN
jgi:hypothetical protein